MFDKSDLVAAVAAGAISRDNADRLEAFLKTKEDSERGLSSENLRFLANFNDIFLTIGIAILMTGLAVLAGIAAYNTFGVESAIRSAVAEEMISRGKMAAIVGSLPVIIGAWLLAEYFCGKRRLLLPSMLLSLIIAAAVAFLTTTLLAPSTEDEAMRMARNNPWDVISNLSYAGFGGATLAAAAIFWRFRLPFSLFLLAGSIAGLFYTSVARIDNGNLIFGGIATLIAGLVTLGFAIWLDSKDPQRTSRISDHAFWLHLAAAPQIINGVRGMVLGSGFAPAGGADAGVMLLVLIAFGVISLMLNRRALIVSGLVTFIMSLWVLVNEVQGGNTLDTLMLTALIVGGAIVLLGGGWRTARRFVLKPIPTTGLAGRIFPPEPVWNAPVQKPAQEPA
jgi:hypothetical protein